MKSEELEKYLSVIKKETDLSEDDLDLAEDILNDLGPNRLVLYNRATRDCAFIDRLRFHYEKERKRQLRIMDQMLASGKFEDFRAAQLRRIHQKLKESDFVRGKLNIKDHNNFEIYVNSRSNVRGRKIDLIGMFNWKDQYNDKEEICKMGDMLLRSGADSVDLYLPYTPDQREDKKDEGRVPISAKLFFNQIHDAFKHKLNRIITINLHSAQAQGFIDIPVDHLTCNNLFARYVLSDYFQEKYAGKEIVVISPDEGGSKNAKKFAELLGVEYVVIDKGTHEKHGEIEINDRNISPYVEGKVCIMIDDMSDTSGTIVKACKNLKKYGAAEVIAMVGHGIFSPKLDDPDKIPAETKLRACGIKVITTDTFPRTPEYYKANSDWLEVLSVAEMLAQVMITNRINRSASSLIYRSALRIKKARDSNKRMNVDYLLV